MKNLLKVTAVLGIAFALLGQGRVSASKPAARCLNVFAEGDAALGLIVIAPGVVTLGALPTVVTLGNVPGLLSSFVTSLEVSGSKGQGAQHITLQHKFESTDPARPGIFTTEDRAVCAPAGKDPAVCRVNEVLTIVSGTGIFANAEGSLRNHGIIDLSTFSLSFSIRGRVCGDGVQERKQPSIPM